MDIVKHVMLMKNRIRMMKHIALERCAQRMNECQEMPNASLVQLIQERKMKEGIVIRIRETIVKSFSRMVL